MDGKNGNSFLVDNRRPSFAKSFAVTNLEQQKRPPVDPCGSPILGSTRRATHSLSFAAKQSSATLGKPPSRAKTERCKPSIPQDVIRGVFAQNFSAEAKIVSTKKEATAKKASVESVGSPLLADTGPNWTMDKAAAEVKKAHIVSTKSGANPSCSSERQSPPVWTQRSDIAMIKSLDSGIKSSESTGERVAESEKAQKEVYEESVGSNVSPMPRRTKSRQSSQRHKTPPPATREPLSLAQPYHQIANHLSFSQEHQQFILPRAAEEANRASVKEDYNSSDDENVLGMDDDEVFADDEVDFGDQTPQSVSSIEDLNGTQPDLSHAPTDSEQSLRAPLASFVRTSPAGAPSPFGHYHPPALGTRSPALRASGSSSTSSRSYAAAAPKKVPVEFKQISLGVLSMQKRKSDMDAHGAAVNGVYKENTRRSSLERQVKTFI